MSFQSKLDKMIYLFPEDFKQVVIAKLQRWKNGDKSPPDSEQAFRSYHGTNYDSDGFMMFTPNAPVYNSCYISCNEDGIITEAFVQTTDPNKISGVIDLFPDTYKNEMYKQINRIKNWQPPIGNHVYKNSDIWVINLGAGFGVEAYVHLTETGEIVMAQLMRSSLNSNLPREEVLNNLRYHEQV